MNKTAKGKRLCSYRKEWEATHPWVKAANDAKKALCTLCCREISIGHGGEYDLTRHQASNIHKKAIQARGSSGITASAKSSVKLKRTVLQDACAASKMHLGRTLQEVITKNIEPSTVEQHVVSDHSVVNGEPVYYYFCYLLTPPNKGNEVIHYHECLIGVWLADLLHASEFHGSAQNSNY